MDCSPLLTTVPAIEPESHDAISTRTKGINAPLCTATTMSPHSRSTSESETPFAVALPKTCSPSEMLRPGTFNRLHTFCAAVAVPRESMNSPAPTTTTTAMPTIAATVCFQRGVGCRGSGGDGARKTLLGGGGGGGARKALLGGGSRGPLGGGHGARERLRFR